MKLNNQNFDFFFSAQAAPMEAMAAPMDNQHPLHGRELQHRVHHRHRHKRQSRVNGRHRALLVVTAQNGRHKAQQQVVTVQQQWEHHLGVGQQQVLVALAHKRVPQQQHRNTVNERKMAKKSIRIWEGAPKKNLVFQWIETYFFFNS